MWQHMAGDRAKRWGWGQTSTEGLDAKVSAVVDWRSDRFWKVVSDNEF